MTHPRIGINIGSVGLDVMALTANGFVLTRERHPLPPPSYDDMIRTITTRVRSLDREYGKGSLGLAVPGSITPDIGCIRTSPFPELAGRNLCLDLMSAIGRPVRIASDADCLALSETTDGAGARQRCAFFLILGKGLGGSLVVDNRILTGPNALGGEWGHSPIPWPREWKHSDERPGPECHCGLTGCTETFLSTQGLIEDHARNAGMTMPWNEIAASAVAGDPDCLETMQRYADRLARALSVIINLVDPEAIVLGGELSDIDWLYERVQQLWSGWAFCDAARTRLLKAAHGNDSAVRGAAWLWDRTDQLRPLPALILHPAD